MCGYFKKESKYQQTGFFEYKKTSHLWVCLIAKKQQKYCQQAAYQLLKKRIQIGDFCTLEVATPHFQWRVGRILQFSYFKERTKRAQQYSSEVVEISGNVARIGVLCSWYNFLCSSQSLQENKNLQITWGNEDHHSFYPVSNYICTLPQSSFEMEEDQDSTTAGLKADSIMTSVNELSIKISTAKHLILKGNAVMHITKLLENDSVTS